MAGSLSYVMYLYSLFNGAPLLDGEFGFSPVCKDDGLVLRVSLHLSNPVY
jgi:hypothetical protein